MTLSVMSTKGGIWALVRQLTSTCIGLGMLILTEPSTSATATTAGTESDLNQAPAVSNSAPGDKSDADSIPNPWIEVQTYKF